MIRLLIDGEACEARRGDTLLTAILTNRPHLRQSEFGDGARAGFCLMGACQDCWVLLEKGGRLRACTTMALDEMRVLTGAPHGTWP